MDLWRQVPVNLPAQQSVSFLFRASLRSAKLTLPRTRKSILSTFSLQQKSHIFLSDRIFQLRISNSNKFPISISKVMTIFLKNLDLSKIKTSRKCSGAKLKKSKSHNNPVPLPPFPTKLYQMLQEVDEQGLDHIVSWQHDGRSFRVHKADKFVTEILPRYFRCSKMKSFQRQLNFYKFQRIIGGKFDGSYSHPQFIRGEEDLAKKIRRQELSQEITSDTLTNTAGDSDSTSSTSSHEDEVPKRETSTTNNDFPFHESQDDLLDSFNYFLESNFGDFEINDDGENFLEGSRLSFLGKKFFFLPVEFTDLRG